MIEANRWPNGPVCPHCESEGESYKLEPKDGGKTHVRKGVYKCGICRKQYTVTVGTIFADSHIPLNIWLAAIHLLCSSKKGMSAHQLHRMLDMTYRSAWFMVHRIRFGMDQEPLSSKLEKLQGTFEVDEMYIGGKEKGMRGKPSARKGSNKATAIAMVERSLVGGTKRRVRSVLIPRVRADNLRWTLRDRIDQSATRNMDESPMYSGLGRWWKKHETVNHDREEYARKNERGGLVTTNAIEGYFGMLKRGLSGVHHHVGRHHLHRYLVRVRFSVQCSGSFGFGTRESDAKGRRRKAAEIPGLVGQGWLEKKKPWNQPRLRNSKIS